MISMPKGAHNNKKKQNKCPKKTLNLKFSIPLGLQLNLFMYKL